MTMLETALGKIEAQQPNERTPVWMVGEQLKDMLRANPQAAKFYDHCTQEQRNAILLQVHMLNTPDKLKAFVDNLPSAAL